MALPTTARAVMYPVRDILLSPVPFSLPGSLFTCFGASSLRTTARFFEEGRSAIIVALRFKAFNLDQEHRLGTGSLKVFECEVAGYRLACRAALATSCITICLNYSDGMPTWDVVVLEIPAGTGVWKAMPVARIPLAN